MGPTRGAPVGGTGGPPTRRDRAPKGSWSSQNTPRDLQPQEKHRQQQQQKQ